MLKRSSFIYFLVHSIVNRTEHIFQLIDIGILPTHVIFCVQRICDVQTRDWNILKTIFLIIMVLNLVFVFVVKAVVQRYVQQNLCQTSWLQGSYHRVYHQKNRVRFHPSIKRIMKTELFANSLQEKKYRSDVPISV